MIVDWTGAGRGPRIWSLAFLLWAAGARELDLVDVVVLAYASHVQLEPEELARLAQAICVRPLVLDTWAVCAGRKRAAEACRGAARPAGSPKPSPPAPGMASSGSRKAGRAWR